MNPDGTESAEGHDGPGTRSRLRRHRRRPAAGVLRGRRRLLGAYRRHRPPDGYRRRSLRVRPDPHPGRPLGARRGGAGRTAATRGTGSSRCPVSGPAASDRCCPTVHPPSARPSPPTRRRPSTRRGRGGRRSIRPAISSSWPVVMDCSASSTSPPAIPRSPASRWPPRRRPSGPFLRRVPRGRDLVIGPDAGHLAHLGDGTDDPARGRHRPGRDRRDACLRLPGGSWRRVRWVAPRHLCRPPRRRPHPAHHDRGPILVSYAGFVLDGGQLLFVGVDQRTRPCRRGSGSSRLMAEISASSPATAPNPGGSPSRPLRLTPVNGPR